MKNLIIFRAGGKSLHHLWLSDNFSYDIYLCPYKEIPQVDESEGIRVGSVIHGSKWSGLRELLNTWDGWKSYQYVMLADDDLFMSPKVPDAFFDLCINLNAKLAQPALTIESPTSHLIVLKNSKFIARSTTFVEIMAPCFRSDVLLDLLWTFELSTTGWGWGLDYLWPKLLAYEGVFVCDCTPMTHAMPVGRNRNDQLLTELNCEVNAILSNFHCKPLYKTLEGILPNGTRLGHNNPALLHNLIKGYETFLDLNPSFLTRLISEQGEEI
jgi:hypothetical protein